MGFGESNGAVVVCVNRDDVSQCQSEPSEESQIISEPIGWELN